MSLSCEIKEATSSTIKETTLNAANGNSSSQDDSAETIVRAEIVIKKYGTIKLDLYADEAPVTVANFVKLAKDGFYDGLTFHRIMEDFMMQGGDPKGDGTGGSEREIKGEFAANDHLNGISHIRGTISMARSGSQYESYYTAGYELSAAQVSDVKRAFNSGSSQFFICHADSLFLDGKYAAFGRVTDGMNIVDKICTESAPIDNNGTIPAEKQPVIETIKIVE